MAPGGGGLTNKAEQTAENLEFMNILYLCSDAGIPILGRKGASVHVREMAGAFGRAGHRVVLAAPVLNKSPWEVPAETGAQVLHLRPGPGVVAAAQAVKEYQNRLGVPASLPGEIRRVLYDRELEAELLRRFDSAPPDFIYERAALFSTAGAAVARRLNVPLLIELNAPLALEHDTYRGNGLGDLGARAERWALSQADAVLTVSEPLRKHVIALGTDAAKVHAIPNGVNPALFYPAPPDAALRERLSLGSGPVLGFVGGLRPWHGIECLPELLERLIPAHPGLRLILVGDGPLRAELEKNLAARGMSERVVFAGAVLHEDVPAWIRLFDVALAPYPALDHEFYFSPLKLFEYMACGVPVAAANSGQISDVVRDGETGLLHVPGDLDGLAAGCHRLLLNPKLRTLIGQAAARSVLDGFTWDHNARRAADLAHGLIARRKTAPPP